MITKFQRGRKMKFSVLPSIRQRGFTLIELLVVIAIIALLAAILFPVFARARENARKSSCQNNLKQIGVAIAQYTQDFDENLPRSRTRGYVCPVCNPATHTNNQMPWHMVVLPYIKSVQAFKCPSKPGNAKVGWSWDGTNDIIPRSYLSNGCYGECGAMGAAPAGAAGARQPMVNEDPNRAATALSEIRQVSSVILVGEHTDRGDPEFWDNEPDTRFRNHLGQTNFLFVDGHVKSMKPIATVTPVNMWEVHNYPAPASWIDIMRQQEARLDRE
jgi:prepilin-type N-terminal cleavage/methylation domain-containing protein/prepilin-type processing-associated H-X9-DG protein